ncbi:hypothetical protein G195_004039 [Phytophthora kernoviae 00238/432]|uniref:Phosphoribulokinase/uridine kinase domain-containing protein n=2 Tax=Phytophthora kernoviae TaxID=325452 RepID=A0A8T0M9I1_9STRA|nr:hypothetical protein G195_004039 [Phytophthora kernoviae 00238/432]KAG2532452.1 hypothetical protein JM16_000392 [Phytophthora kernoviae]
MATAFLERTQRLRQHIEALIRHDATKRSQTVDERALRHRVDDYYLPMFRWTEEVVEAVQEKQGDTKQCVCIGLSCPQGGGKTTASLYMQEVLALMGKKCAVMSLDDVYWKYEQQVAVAKASPSNPLLQYRGNPGTMDVPFLLDLVRECKTSTSEIALPREHMKAVNKELRAFDKFYEELDGLIVIKIADLDWVYEWREQPEQLLREANKPAMTPDQVRDFVDRFMPGYKTYTGTLYADPKTQLDAKGAEALHLWSQPSKRVATVPRLVFSITSARESAEKPVEYNFESQALQN